MSENGPTQLHTQCIDFTSPSLCHYADRESLLFWTIVAMTGFRTHPEHTPRVRQRGRCTKLLSIVRDHRSLRCAQPVISLLPLTLIGTEFLCSLSRSLSHTLHPSRNPRSHSNTRFRSDTTWVGTHSNWCCKNCRMGSNESLSKKDQRRTRRNQRSPRTHSTSGRTSQSPGRTSLWGYKPRLESERWS